MIILKAIKVGDGYYISGNVNFRGSYNQTYINGKVPKLSFHPDWFFIEEEPKRITTIIKQSNINHRFILVDESLKSNKIPLEIKKSDAGEENCDGHFIWKPELAMYRSLYVEISDPRPDEEIELEFKFEVLFEIPEIKPPPEFKYQIITKSFLANRQIENITSKNIIHQDLDRIIFPSILLHGTPCKITGEMFFNIIRKNISDCIDTKSARIIKDYDFLFEIVKVIPLVETCEKTRKYVPIGKRKPVVEKIMVTNKEITVFKIAPKPYQDAQVVPEIEASSEEGLGNKIDGYLKNLIIEINRPFRECSYCKGTGVSEYSNTKINISSALS